MTIYDQHLDKNAANFVALSPVSFVERTAEVFGDLPAVVHGQRRYTWAQTRERSARLAAALKAHGIGRGQTVSTMLANTPEMVEAHYAVPALGAVLNTLNTRLDAALLAWQLNHCESEVLITDREFAPVIAPAPVRKLRLLVILFCSVCVSSSGHQWPCSCVAPLLVETGIAPMAIGLPITAADSPASASQNCCCALMACITLEI